MPDEKTSIADPTEDTTLLLKRWVGGVEMRFFGGLTESDVASALGVSRLTVSRDWRVARLLLSRTLSPDAAS